MAKAAMKPETKAEAVARQVADQLDPPPHFLLVELPGGSYRAATLAERAEAENRRLTLEILRSQVKALEDQIKPIKQHLDLLREQCPHTVSYDTDDGWICTRWCYGCGKSQGSI